MAEKGGNDIQNLIQGDCLTEMDKLIEQGINVDCILTDPPYGTTACKWDSVIPFEPMWERLNKLIKPNGAIVLFGSEPFSSALRMSNIKNYKYDWIWDKKGTNGFLNAKKRPLKRYEIVSVFSNGLPKYFPQMEVRGEPRSKGSYNHKIGDGDMVYGKFENIESFNNVYYPTNIVENETVLDFTMGSGSTGVACKNLNRNFIGIELDEKYFEIAQTKIAVIKPVRTLCPPIRVKSGVTGQKIYLKE